jgi:hypothetical protein
LTLPAVRALITELIVPRIEIAGDGTKTKVYDVPESGPNAYTIAFFMNSSLRGAGVPADAVPFRRTMEVASRRDVDHAFGFLNAYVVPEGVEAEEYAAFDYEWQHS